MSPCSPTWATAASRRSVDYATGYGPYSVAIGDLNGDGKPELATANADQSTVSVLANRGDGSFEAKLDYATGDLPVSVAIGDLNGDAKPELTTANVADSVSVLANATGLCVVPKVTGKTLTKARRTMSRTDCRVGKVRRAYSKTLKKGRVISQKPRPGTVLPTRSKVSLIVSRGRVR